MHVLMHTRSIGRGSRSQDGSLLHDNHVCTTWDARTDTPSRGIFPLVPLPIPVRLYLILACVFDKLVLQVRTMIYLLSL